LQLRENRERSISSIEELYIKRGEMLYLTIIGEKRLLKILGEKRLLIRELVEEIVGRENLVRENLVLL